MSQIEIPFYWLDVFTSDPFKGNPVAVFMMNTGLEDNLYLKLAKELKLSEIAITEKTDESEYKLRYFGQNNEVSLCGHATIGTAYTLSTEYNIQSPITFQTSKSGNIVVDVKDSLVTINFPQYPLPESGDDEIASILGVDEYEECYMSVLVVGSKEQVRKVDPDFGALRRFCEAHGLPGAIVTSLDDDGEYDYVCRVFMWDVEDPVTGLAQSYLAPYWGKRLDKTKMLCHQISHRDGVLSVELVDDIVRISSTATLLLKGTLSLKL